MKSNQSNLAIDQNMLRHLKLGVIRVLKIGMPEHLPDVDFLREYQIFINFYGFAGFFHLFSCKKGPDQILAF